MKSRVFDEGIETVFGMVEFDEVVRRPSRARKRVVQCPVCGWKVEARRVEACRRCGEWLQ